MKKKKQFEDCKKIGIHFYIFCNKNFVAEMVNFDVINIFNQSFTNICLKNHFEKFF